MDIAYSKIYAFACVSPVAELKSITRASRTSFYRSRAIIKPLP